MTGDVEVVAQKHSVDILLAANNPQSVSWLNQNLSILNYK
jgi:hypothetical protein